MAFAAQIVWQQLSTFAQISIPKRTKKYPTSHKSCWSRARYFKDEKAKTISSFRAEQIQIEQQLIDIQEARLSLRRRELDLLNEKNKLN
jgi:hypothetical protein